MILIINSLDNKTLNPKLLPWMVYAKKCHCSSSKAAAAAATTHSGIHDQMSGLQTLRKLSKRSENSQDNKDCSTFTFMISGWSWSKCCYNVICTIQVTKKVTRVICLPLQPFCWNLDFHFVQLISHAILPQFWIADNQGVSKGQNNKRTSPRESSNQEKKIATAAAAAATLGTFSNSVSNLLLMIMMMMMMIFSTSVVQNLAGNNRYSCQRFSSSVCSSDADPQEAFPIEEKKRRSDEEKVERVSNNTRLQIECRRRWGSLPLRRLSSSSSSSSSGF